MSFAGAPVQNPECVALITGLTGQDGAYLAEFLFNKEVVGGVCLPVASICLIDGPADGGIGFVLRFRVFGSGGAALSSDFAASCAVSSTVVA